MSDIRIDVLYKCYCDRLMGQNTCRNQCECCDKEQKQSQQQAEEPLSVHRIKTGRGKEPGKDIMPAWHDLQSCIPHYMDYIESHLRVDYKIEGLGHYNQIEGYYQWYIRKWYDDCVQQQIFKPNPYDILALAFAQCHNEAVRDRGLAWYRRMKRKHSRYQILIGYAHLLYLKKQYQKALRVYKKVADINPEWERPYECIALIQQYDLQRPQKSTEMALTILEMNSENMWAMLVMARNCKTYKQRFEQYQALTKSYPSYPRATKELGVIYSEKKLFQESMNCFKHCIELAQPYAECYNNIGYCYQLKGEVKMAMGWYMEAIRRDPQNYHFHSNLIVVLGKLQYIEKDVLQMCGDYEDVELFVFCYKLGVAYYDKEMYQQSLNWYDRALEIPNKDHYKVHNALGVSYDFLQQHATARQCFLQCIKLSPETQSAYQNLAMSWKAQYYIPQTIEWYVKSIEVNPKQSQAYSSLATLFEEREQYDKALDYYRQGCYYRPHNAIAQASYGFCLLKNYVYQEGFRVINRARLCLPLDEDVPEQSRDFLKEVFRRTKQEQDQIELEGMVRDNQRKNIIGLIHTFQQSVKPLEMEEGLQNIPHTRAMRPQTIDIINQAAKSQLSLTNFSSIANLIWQLHLLNEEYFHILPQLLIQYYWKEKIENHKSIGAIQEAIGEKIASFLRLEGRIVQQPCSYFEQISLRYFKNDQFRAINLFSTTLYFSDYDQLVAQIFKVNDEAKKVYPNFLSLTAQIRQQSQGIPIQEGMRIPDNQNRQFQVLVEMLRGVFEKELTPRRLQSIRARIDSVLRGGEGKSSSDEVLFEIAKTWMLSVGQMLQQRQERYVPTHLTVADLMWSHMEYQNVDDLLDAVQIAQQIIINKHYKVVDLMINRKNGLQVTINVEIKAMVGQIKLILKQNTRKEGFIKALLQLRDLPLGTVFGSYISMARLIHYPFLDNCRDVLQILNESEERQDRWTKEACMYLIEELQATQS